MDYDEYARVKASAPDRQQRLDRKSSPLAALRAFHNRVKFDLITRHTSRGGSLLDVACGRGGDLGKWRAAGLAYVLAFDASGDSVDEARRRHSVSYRSVPVDFLCLTTFGTDEAAVVSDEPFDAVSCMFAMHYFWGARDVFLENVARALKPGGVFFGIVPDGDKVLRFSNARSEVCRVDLAGDGTYTMRLADTVVENAVLGEHLVFENDLKDSKQFQLEEFWHLNNPDAGYPFPLESGLYAAFVMRKKQ